MSAEAKITNPFTAPQFPEDLSPEEREEAINLSNLALDSINVGVLAMLTADEVFGERVDEPNEDLFLGQVIDETQPIQAEFMARVCNILEENGLEEPERCVIQLFRRRGGFRTKKTDDKLGNYTMAICMKDYQVIVYDKEENLLSAGTCSQLYDISEIAHPSVPFKRTQVSTGGGKATIKNREYLSVLVWAYWSESPEKKEAPQISEEDLQKLMEKFKESPPSQEGSEAAPAKEPVKEIVL